MATKSFSLERIKLISRVLLVLFYAFAGVNHFVNPEFYYPLIPDYFVFQEEINLAAGILEVSFAFLFIFKPTRRWAAGGTILMLAAFIPSHVYFIQIGGCVPDGLCVPAWVGWVRLIIVHPMLMGWAWWHRS